MNVSNVEVTAGLGGFLVLFGLGLVLWFIGRDLSRRLRRMRRAEALRQDEARKRQEPEHGPREHESLAQEAPRDPDGPTSTRE